MLLGTASGRNVTCHIPAGKPDLASQVHSCKLYQYIIGLAQTSHLTVQLFSVNMRSACHQTFIRTQIRRRLFKNKSEGRLRNCRDPVYFQIKATLWDLFPAWEDKQIDTAFREMLWASQGCECPPGP